MKEMSHSHKQKLYVVIMVIVFAISVTSIVWMEKSFNKEFEEKVTKIVLEKEEDFKNDEYTLNELLFEIAPDTETRYRDTRDKTLKQVEKVVFENYDRENPLYQELFINK